MTNDYPEMSEDDACDRLIELHHQKKSIRKKMWRDTALLVTQLSTGITLLSMFSKELVDHRRDCDFNLNQNIYRIGNQLAREEIPIWSKIIFLGALGAASLACGISTVEKMDSTESVNREREELLKKNAKWFKPDP